MERKTYTFDEIPNIMADVVVQLKALADKVDSLSSHDRIRATSKGEFVPSHRTTLTTKAVCKLLHKDRQAVYRLVAAGSIPYYKQGKTLGFFEDEIYDWLEKKKGAVVNMSAVDAAAREYCINNGL